MNQRGRSPECGPHRKPRCPPPPEEPEASSHQRPVAREENPRAEEQEGEQADGQVPQVAIRPAAPPKCPPAGVRRIVRRDICIAAATLAPHTPLPAGVRRIVCRNVCIAATTPAAPTRVLPPLARHLVHCQGEDLQAALTERGEGAVRAGGRGIQGGRRGGGEGARVKISRLPSL